MWYKRISYEKALAHVLKRRTIVNPNQGFREKLKEYEKKLGLDKENYDHLEDKDFADIEW